MVFNREPQCSKCRVDLFPANLDAIRVWFLTESQMIVGGMGSVIGVNQLAIWEVIDRYPIKIKKPFHTFEKVLKVFNEVTMEQIRGGENEE